MLGESSAELVSEAAPRKRGVLAACLRYPRNLYLLPMLLALNHLVAIGELGSAIWLNSLGLFSHGSHTIFNSILLTGLVTSVLVNWESSGRYSLSQVGLVARSNFLVGVLLLGNAAVVGYLSLRGVLEPPEIRRESLFYLVPLPALLLDLVGVYVVQHGYDGEHTDKAADATCRHMLANALGSLAAVLAALMVQTLGWTAADAACALFVACLMGACSVCLVHEAVASRQKPIFTVSDYVKNELNQIFHA